MAQIVGNMAVSLDGYIADKQGGVGWLDPFQSEELGFSSFLRGIGTVVMGRITHDQIWSFGIGWPYPGKRTIVVTHRPLPARPDGSTDGFQTFAGEVRELVSELRRGEGGDAWLVGGARLQRELIALRALQRLELAVIPVLLGDGLPLFPRGEPLPAPVLSVAEPIGKTGIARLVYRWPGA